MKDIVEIARLIDKGHKAGCDMSFCETLMLSEIARVYNGTGPDSWPSWARAKLDEELKLFAPAVMVHDCDFEFSDGSRDQFYAANDRLTENCVKLADARYSGWSPIKVWKRLRARAAGRLMGRLCNDFGWSAYLDAHKSKTMA